MTTLEREIREALQPRRATAAEIDAWTATALEQRPTPPRRRMWPLVAAAVLLGALGAWLLYPEGAAPASYADAGSVLEERERNLKVLNGAETQRALYRNAGKVAVIAGERLFIDADPKKALAAADAHAPGTPHRFVFRITRGKPPFHRTYREGEILVRANEDGLARYETPGLAKVENAAGLRRVFRRYYAPVGDGMADIAAGPESYWYADRVWGPEPRPETVRGKRVLVLLVPHGVKRVPVKALDGLSPEFLDIFAATCARRVDKLGLPNGRDVAMPGDSRPVALAIVRDGVREYVRPIQPGTNPRRLEAEFKFVAGKNPKKAFRQPPTPKPLKLVDGYLTLDFLRLSASDKPLAELDGKKVVITGYVIPIKWDKEGSREFVLVRNQAACCFGEVPKMNEWIHVTANKPLKVEMDVPTTIWGTLSAGEVKEDGIVMSLYRLAAERAK